MGAATSIDHPRDRLTPRERAVLNHIASGQRVRQVSDAMGVSINTVKFHLKNIYAKLGADGRREAVQMMGSRHQHSQR